jgi:zinc-ribbon domain
MICPYCGREIADHAQSCPNCGISLETTRRGVTEVFSRGASLALSKRGLRFFPSLVGVYFVTYAIVCLAVVATAYAALGTLRFHRIVNTGCFVKAGGTDNFSFRAGGPTTTDYKLRPHCDWFPLSVNWDAFAVGLAVSIVVIVLAVAASYIVVVRLADRLGEGSARRVVPTLPEVVRAIGRVVGWSILVYAGGVAVVAVTVAAFAVGVAALPKGLAVMVGIALGVALIYAYIRYLVPWYVRASLTLVIVFADDRRVRAVWQETKMRALTAWKIVGILLVIGIATGVMDQISSVFLSRGTVATSVLGAILYVVVLAAQIGAQTLFLVMAARQTQRGWKT